MNDGPARFLINRQLKTAHCTLYAARSQRLFSKYHRNLAFIHSRVGRFTSSTEWVPENTSRWP